MGKTGHEQRDIKRDQTLTSGYNAYILNVKSWCYIHQEPHTWAEHQAIQAKKEKPV